MYDVLRISSNNNHNNNNNRIGCEKCNDSDDDGWFSRFDEKGSDVYMKHCKVLIEPIKESMCFYISMQKIGIRRKV